jgi:hypothetical protein
MPRADGLRRALRTHALEVRVLFGVPRLRRLERGELHKLDRDGPIPSAATEGEPVRVPALFRKQMGPSGSGFECSAFLEWRVARVEMGTVANRKPTTVARVRFLHSPPRRADRMARAAAATGIIGVRIPGSSLTRAELGWVSACLPSRRPRVCVPLRALPHRCPSG